MKRILSILMCVALALTLTGSALSESSDATPKYVFMFIGDGQGSPQINATQYYLGTLANPGAAIPKPAQLSFTGFPYVGIMTTYDATSFCPDSASTATSMASGNKTLSGVINYNIDKTESFKLITEYAKEQGKKVGVLSSVSIDHATPAAYYAKAVSRSMYYDIAVQGLSGQTLDFVGGGGYLQPTGAAGDQPALTDIAIENGFTIASTNDEIRALNADSGRVLAVVPDPDGSKAMQYEIDRQRIESAGGDSLSLSEMTQKAIDTLYGDDGFFLMVEGGKVDWSCHANDAKTSILETIAFSDAVNAALEFASAHPDETLIIVTGDHETGGLTIGFATTAYDTHFDYLAAQDISYADFDKVIAQLRDSGASFEQALAEIEARFGLTQTPDTGLSLTEEELAKLEAAYELSMTPSAERVIGKSEALAYGGYEPLSMACCHILNNKAGIAYTSYAHTGLQIPIYAYGVGAASFSGSYDNTDIFFKTMDAMGVEADAI
ncbi:MAG: alkaline phosphatase [Oscillospiraceae bacterium]|jgi:alkaline phosphatase|nr:alkaline phosphatase [Oscillospiraceae bacterium]